ncbi:MAG TPA: DUF885 family protein [Allosphingosinicella sp.]|jgi:uncharacterized protein (DUF885 family)
MTNYARLDRRTFLLTSAAFGLAGCATTAVPGAAGGRDAKLDALLTRWFEEDLGDDPEFATNLGLDTGARAALRAQLADETAAHGAAERAEAKRRHAELQAFGRGGLSEAGQLNYDVAEFRQSVQAQGADFPFGEIGGRPAPYVLSQLGGAYYSVPDFLDSTHPVESKADADGYVSRLEDFARNLEAETERLRSDAAMGVIPPDFVVDKTIANLRALRSTPAAETTLVQSIDRRSHEKGLGDYSRPATRLVSGPIAQALDRQIAALEAVRPRAAHDAGVWRLPDGEAFYRYGLRFNTTTDYTPDEIHRIGLDQVRDLHARIDALLRAQGYTKGSVGERLNAINKEERFLFPNTDPGRAELLAMLNRQVAEIAPRLPRVFATLPKAALEIRRVPETIEAGAPGGYYQGASLDGSRPGAYYINLKDTHEWPKNGLPTLTYHEGIPGHHFQISVSREAGELPLYRRTRGFAAYNEGWALYAERVADELGVYENDPFGRIGFLQSYLFRATRLVVDTGMHAKRWSREQAIRWMVDNAAEPEGSAVREIERYVVWPGQACAYKLGETVISRLRAEAEARPGFDIRRFHDAVLLGGSLPLTVLERRVKAEMA